MCIPCSLENYMYRQMWKNTSLCERAVHYTVHSGFSGIIQSTSWDGIALYPCSIQICHLPGKLDNHFTISKTLARYTILQSRTVPSFKQLQHNIMIVYSHEKCIFEKNAFKIFCMIGNSNMIHHQKNIFISKWGYIANKHISIQWPLSIWMWNIYFF